MSIEGEIPPYDHVIYSDAGWEPAAVYAQVDWLEAKCQEAGIPFHRVSGGSIREDTLVETGQGYGSMPLHVESGGSRPSILRRQCSKHYKILPVLRKLRELAGLRPYQHSKAILVECHLGISLDEVNRMRSGERPWIENVYPLVDLRMTRQDCLTWCRDHGYPEPPRSSCLGCPLKSSEDWAELRKSPAEWADAVAFDEALRTPGTRIAAKIKGQAYLHRSCKPLAELDVAQEQPGLFDEECTGGCFT